MDGTWPGSVKFSPSPHFSVYFQHYTHTQPFATKHFLYDVRTVEQNISLCFPHLDFPFFFSRFAWMETPGLSRRKAEVKRHWHSISIIGIYIFFFFFRLAVLLGVMFAVPFSSLLIPPRRVFFFRSEEIVYSRERQEGF